MKVLLDTNALVDYLNGRYPKLTRRIQAAAPDDVCTSSIVIAELRFGAEKSRHKARNHDRIDVLAGELQCLPFDVEAARTFGLVRRDLEARGKTIGPYDLLIGSHALSRGITLVTDNVREFRRVPGLRVVNWRC